MGTFVDPFGGYKESMRRKDELRQREIENERNAARDRLANALLNEQLTNAQERRKMLADVRKVREDMVKTPGTTRTETVLDPTYQNAADTGIPINTIDPSLNTKQQVVVPPVNYTPQEQASREADVYRKYGDLESAAKVMALTQKENQELGIFMQVYEKTGRNLALTKQILKIYAPESDVDLITDVSQDGVVKNVLDPTNPSKTLGFTITLDGKKTFHAAPKSKLLTPEEEAQQMRIRKAGSSSSNTVTPSAPNLSYEDIAKKLGYNKTALTASLLNKIDNPQFNPVGKARGSQEQRVLFENAYGRMLEKVGVTPEQVMSASKDVKADTKAYLTLNNDYERTMEAVEQTKQFATLVHEKNNEWKRSNYPAPNKFWNWAQKNLSNKELAQFEMSLLAFSREYMRVTTGASRSVAELSVGAQSRVDDVLNKFDSWDVMNSRISQAEKEIDGVRTSYEKRLGAIKGRLDKAYGMFNPQVEQKTASAPVWKNVNGVWKQE